MRSPTPDQIWNIVSVSGGKDSTALALLAAERETENLIFVFADTGHEHETTYEYIQYLDGTLRSLCGVGITTVRADFSDRIRRKRSALVSRLVALDGAATHDRYQKGWIARQLEQAIDTLIPTGVPFLGLCLWKGRFPSTRARFCSQELKHFPMQKQVVDPLIAKGKTIISWQGVRADESKERADLPMHDVEFGCWEPEPEGLLIYRPLIHWTAQDAFEMHRRHGVDWNPLYEQGMGRVGCMPCIHANKKELREIATRFPDEVARVAKWERLVNLVSKRGFASFFASDKTPGDHVGRADQQAPGITEVMDWALTSRGGRQYDLIATSEDSDSISCTSIYGLCE